MIMNRAAFNCLMGILGLVAFGFWFWSCRASWGFVWLGINVVWGVVAYATRKCKRW